MAKLVNKKAGRRMVTDEVDGMQQEVDSKRK